MALQRASPAFSKKSKIKPKQSALQKPTSPFVSSQEQSLDPSEALSSHTPRDMAELDVEKFYSRLGKIYASFVKNRYVACSRSL